MTNFYDNDILISQIQEDVTMDLECGYGQPCVSTVYLKRNNGGTEKILSLDGECRQLVIGKLENLKYQAIEIHTTIEDIRDSQEEMVDISLLVRVNCGGTQVSTHFTKKTRGKGIKIHAFYTVTIF